MPPRNRRCVARQASVRLLYMPPRHMASNGASVRLRASVPNAGAENISVAAQPVPARIALRRWLD